MRLSSILTAVLSACALVTVYLGAGAQAAERRIALVVGNAAYQAGPRATAANDAGLVAQTLQAAGFDVVGARDLDEDALHRSLRDFLDKAAASGPDTVTVVYLAGYGLQLEGENYFAPVDLRVTTAADVSLRAQRLSDYTRSLAALPLKARLVVFDGAYRAPFAVLDKPLAGGLALTEAEPGSLVAFNAAPGTIGPTEPGPYGAYARALVEMIREGGLQPGPLFDRVRLRVDAATKGAEVPWDADRLNAPFVFLERTADAPALGRLDQVAALRRRPLRDLGAHDAYAVCLERDDLDRYQEFVADYPDDALARRVRALIAARREALVWRRTWIVGTPDAYWSYLARYPRGPHAWDARRRLASLAAALEPPPRYVTLVYDVPPPPPEEIAYVDRPVLFFDDPVFALPPPPPPAVVFLPPPPAYLVALAPPPPVVALYALPTPPIVAVPAYVSAPAYVAPPPNAVLFQNIHDATVIEQINRQNAVVQAPGGVGTGTAVGAGALAGAALGAAATHVALPPALQQRAGVAPAPAPGGIGASGPQLRGALPAAAPAPGATTAARPQIPGQPQPGHTLPGANGQPLPGQPAPRPALRAATPQATPGIAAPPARQAARPAGQPPSPTGPGRATVVPSAPGARALPTPIAPTAPMQPARGQATGPAGATDPSLAGRAAADVLRRQDALALRAAAQAQVDQRRQAAQAARQQRTQQASQQRQAAQSAQQAQRAQQAAQRQQQAAQKVAARQQRAQAIAQRQMAARPMPGARPSGHPAQPPHSGSHSPCHLGASCR